MQKNTTVVFCIKEIKRGEQHILSQKTMGVGPLEETPGRPGFLGVESSFMRFESRKKWRLGSKRKRQRGPHVLVYVFCYQTRFFRVPAVFAPQPYQRPDCPPAVADLLASIGEKGHITDLGKKRGLSEEEGVVVF